MNKILGLAAGVSMLAMVAMPVMARDHDRGNGAVVRTSVNTTSNTGGNNTTVNGSGNANGSTNFVGTSTGNAVSKTAVVSVVNTNISF